MATEGGDSTPMEKTQNHNSAETHNTTHEGNGSGMEETTISHDELLQMVTQLRLENEFLKSQFESLKNLQSEEAPGKQQKEISRQDGEDAEKLLATIDLLNKELLEEKQTRSAAEEALKHLRTVYSEADARAQELSTKLAEAHQKMNQEIKEREEKYSELDSKFSRLHKRAKQRIQDVQKEKDDLEARFREVNETSERASSQQSALQQEVERTRHQANEALKAMDAERQQLRSTCNKLRDEIEEIRRSLMQKELSFESSQQSLLEKEQMLEDLRELLKAADEKKQISLNELSAKHQKDMENMENLLADAISDGNKATAVISSLQAVVAEKESKIADIDAASSGEAARLRAALETVKGEISDLKSEHAKERESWDVTCQALKLKLEVAESKCIHAEVEVARLRSQLEVEMSLQAQTLNSKDVELATAKKEMIHLQSEFSSYKSRAHALLQKKEAELAAANNSEQIKALEEALKELEKEASQASLTRDRAIQDLEAALSDHDKELAERDAALLNARKQSDSIEMKLQSVINHHQKEKEAWELETRNLEDAWRIRYDAMKAEIEAASGQDLKKELEDLKMRYKRLKGDHDSFRDLADRMIEEKDKEISRLFDENSNLQRSLELRGSGDQNDGIKRALQKSDSPMSGTSPADEQILLLARQQAQREEELAQSQRHILALQEEIEELEHENRLHAQQEAMLKAELRNMERSQRREGVDMTYLKNVILKLLETGEVEALLPVVAMLLQFSPEEMQKCQQAYHTNADLPASPVMDSSTSSRSLFSRFAFS
ncbi:hypothetical protein SAY87_021196 [Trapa incisa]|uniref:GRIP domain-containing protein n=1 Tax=Trapa incisa TaxID=236973 RepID=A0AAN7JRR7_9MYRT|nr:hypothetical protein SAY87_021196 [Trapa incisa]